MWALYSPVSHSPQGELACLSLCLQEWRNTEVFLCWGSDMGHKETAGNQLWCPCKSLKNCQGSTSLSVSAAGDREGCQQGRDDFQMAKVWWVLGLGLHKASQELQVNSGCSHHPLCGAMAIARNQSVCVQRQFLFIEEKDTVRQWVPFLSSLLSNAALSFDIHPSAEKGQYIYARSVFH